MIPLQRNALFRRIKEKLAARRGEKAQDSDGKAAAVQDKRLRKLGPKLAH
ncbi:MAG: hypothetical protein IJR41_02210 [Atopobiaceae bacterium]|nr:hypothetical protein [Atopobiaceae bacterium]